MAGTRVLGERTVWAKIAFVGERRVLSLVYKNCRITRGDRIEGGLSVAAQDWQGSVQTWVVNHQATLGWVSGALVIAAITWITIGQVGMAADGQQITHEENIIIG